MAKRKPQRSSREFPRTARVNQLLREIVAEEVGRSDDERLELVTIMDVEVDHDLRHAVVRFDTLAGLAGDTAEDEPIQDALDAARVRLQAAIARQARLKRVPELRFVADTVERQASRVEDILRDLRDSDGDT